jgi:hypothetical protein
MCDPQPAGADQGLATVDVSDACTWAATETFIMFSAARYVRFLSSRGRLLPLAVIATWTCLAIAGGCLTPLFLSSTTNDMGVPSGAPSRLARSVAAKLNLTEIRDAKQALTVMLELREASATTPTLASDPRTAQFSEALRHLLAHQFGPKAVAWDGFLDSLARGESMLAQGFLSADGRTGLLTLQVDPARASVASVARYLSAQLGWGVVAVMRILFDVIFDIASFRAIPPWWAHVWVTR